MAIDKVDAKEREKIEAVRKLLRKQAPLSAKQAQYCNDACVERFLRSRGESVKKAAKHLRTVLSWRETVGADHIMADEFSAELADGVAFVSGHDDDGRPVVVFRIKQDYPKFHSQKSFVRLLVFTLEVAVVCMSRFVDQFVLLFDASFFRSASAFLNLLMGTLKIVADYYPGRLHRAFVIDPPSLFSVLWKGVRPFVELAPATAVVCSLDFEDSLEDASFTAYPRTASLRYEPAVSAAAVVGKAGVGSASSRFSVTPTDNPTAAGAAEGAVRRWVDAAGGRLVLDGGLATELEANGADLNDPLWSAKCLLSSSHLIRKVHMDYLEAGANILITASYQATIQGFESKGFSKEQSEKLLTKSVEIALEARDMFLKEHLEKSIPIQHPILVAASIGSYGAYLADGSEYSGDYGEAGTKEFLKDFHRRRLQVLAEAGPDLIAFETIPNKLEAQAYVELLEECNINIPAWLSFNSKDGVHIVSGDSLIECATIADKCAKVGAVGINCTPPRFIHGLILSIRKVTDKPILIYPNSGERYDGEKKEWVESTGVSDGDFVSYVNEWCKDGAALIGGCCRTTPNTIRAIQRTLNQGFNEQHLPVA